MGFGDRMTFVRYSAQDSSIFRNLERCFIKFHLKSEENSNEVIINI